MHYSLTVSRRVTNAGGTKHHRLINVLLLTCGIMLPTLPSAGATTYYADPTAGNMLNPGTSNSPWSTLEAVFTANKTFVAGDMILLRSGYHGFPQIKGTNSGEVTIQPVAGANPTVKKLVVKAAAYWVILGLDICPSNAGPGLYDPNAKLVDIQSACHHITLRNCVIKGAPSIVGWTQSDWTNRLGGWGVALSTAAPSTTFYQNTLQNVCFGLQVLKTATNSLISHNRILEFYNDGMRGLADFCTFEYNTIIDQYISDANHDDFFQSWSTGPTGTVGEGTVYNVTLRGNLFINHTDPAQPLRASAQGIGCFDGMFENWVIENNVISSATYHGISLYGAINCRIVNNTVVENPVTGSTSVKPWIMITEHKNQTNGSPWPVISSGNLIRNNISAAAASMNASSGTKDHNLTTTAYNTFFVNYTNFDFSLLPTAPAVDAGEAISAPTNDITKRARTATNDVGAYEYGATNTTGCDYAAWQATWFPNDPMASDPAAIPFNDGIPNLLKYLFNINPLFPISATDRNALPAAGTEIVGGARQLTWTFRTNAAAADVRFELQAITNFQVGTWQPLTPDGIQILSREPVTGDQTIRIKVNASDATRKFLRLKVNLP